MASGSFGLTRSWSLREIPFLPTTRWNTYGKIITGHAWVMYCPQEKSQWAGGEMPYWWARMQQVVWFDWQSAQSHMEWKWSSSPRGKPSAGHIKGIAVHLWVSPKAYNQSSFTQSLIWDLTLTALFEERPIWNSPLEWQRTWGGRGRM